MKTRKDLLKVGDYISIGRKKIIKNPRGKYIIVRITGNTGIAVNRYCKVSKAEFGKGKNLSIWLDPKHAVEIKIPRIPVLNKLSYMTKTI